MTREEIGMRTLVRESDVIDRTDGSELAKAFNHLWEKYIEQEPKAGHWIEKEGWDGDVYYECSVCKEPFCLIDGTPTDNLYNYCPNCGARMESEEE